MPRRAGGRQGRGLGGGLGAGPQPALLPAARQQGLEVQPPADVLHADALGGADFMAAEGEQIHPQLRRGEGYLQKGLHRVAVEQGGGAGVPDGLGGLRHGEKGAQLVVHQHHGHQHRVGPQGGPEGVGGHVAAPIRLEVGHLIPLGGQDLHRLQHGGVLDGGGDDVPSLPPSILCGGPDGPVVPLGAAGGEDQLLRRAAQAAGHGGAVLLQRGGGGLPQGIPGGGVAVPLSHGLQGGPGGLRTHPGGGGII